MRVFFIPTALTRPQPPENGSTISHHFRNCLWGSGRMGWDGMRWYGMGWQKSGRAEPGELRPS